MAQTIPRNPVIPNGPGDLRNRFPSQPNPYNIPAYPAPPPRSYAPSGGTPSLNPFANRGGVALPGVPKTPGGNYVGPPLRQPYTYPGTRPHPGNWQPPTKSWAPREPLWRPGQPVQGVPSGFNWSINTRSRPNLPALPRSPGLNPRWPRWLRIPPRMTIPAIAGLAHVGLGILRPSPTDILFGIIPDAMEASRPWVWQQLGIKPPVEPTNTQDPNSALDGMMGQCPVMYRYEINVAETGWSYASNFMGPITAIWTSRGPTRWAININGSGANAFNIPFEVRFLRVDGLPDNCGVAPTPTTAPTANPLSLTNGIQPGTPPYSGMPVASPSGRPASDPRGYRPDIQEIPQTASQPRVQTQAEPETEQSATNCRFTPANQAERDTLNNKIRDLNEEIRLLLRENEDLQRQLAAANQATFMQVPYVVENSQGERVRQNYPLSLRGLVDTTAVAALSNQTADWAMQKGDKTEKIYQILGGDQTWGTNPQPQAEINPDAQLRAQPVIDEAGLGRMLQFQNLPQLLTGTQAALYQRQGLQQFPVTIQPPQFNQSGLLPETTTPQVFRTATDVTVTTTSKGLAVIKGMNEVITKTRQTIQWLRLDRLLGLLNLAANIHNGAMLSRNLLETLGSTIGNVLATVGVKDAEGQPFDVGDMIGDTVQNWLKTLLGESTVAGINENWNKANRILTAASGVIFALRSIADSILSALTIGFGWVAKIGNALELAGVIHERFWALVNPNPNFSNRFFTAIERSEELLGNIDSVAGEVQSIGDSIGDINRNRTDLEEMLRNGDKPDPILPHKPSTDLAAENKQRSLGAPAGLPDLVPPPPPTNQP